jgi:hypothetical protein
MAGAADLEVDLALALELNLLVVEAPRQEHPSIRAEQLVGSEAFVRGRREETAVARLDPALDGRALHAPSSGIKRTPVDAPRRDDARHDRAGAGRIITSAREV